MMGEVTNLQMYSPEIVTGYVMLFNVAEDAHSRLHGATWGSCSSVASHGFRSESRRRGASG